MSSNLSVDPPDEGSTQALVSLQAALDRPVTSPISAAPTSVNSASAAGRDCSFGVTTIFPMPTNKLSALSGIVTASLRIDGESAVAATA